jgi:predicted amidohydrolase YtcJ
MLLLLPQFLTAQDHIFYNARIFTANPYQPSAEAVAIRGNKILAVGSFSEVKKAAGENAVMEDMQGQTLLPGLIDSHTHAVKGGVGLTKANVSDKQLSVNELLVYAKEVLQTKEGMTGEFLVILGMNISAWSYLDELDKAFNSGSFISQPVVLRGSDGHTAWVNKAMLQKAGINKNFINALNEEDKLFFGHTADNEPTGFISESGYTKITAILPPPDDIVGAQKAMEYNNGFGITAWLDPSAGNTKSSRSSILDGYTKLIKENKLTAHVAATIVARADDKVQPQIDTVKLMQKKYNSRNLSVLGFKIFGDGVIEHPTHTAAISLPYTGTGSKGVLMFDPGKFAAFATAADKQKLLVHVHAIGDRAVTETLNGFEKMRKANKNNIIPHSITHLQIVLPQDFKRFKQLNVLVSLQLLWAFGDITTIDIVKPYIDSSLYKWQYPAASLLKSGAIICGASDWPVSSGNPFEAIYNAETRMGPMGVLDSTQCIPRIYMLYAYTINAAKALMMEKQTGSIEPGKYADMILLDRDVMTADAESMRDTRVLWTMFEGRKVYERKN